MEGFIDIHCHCLAEVDDGAKTMKDSLEMLSQAYEDGIRSVIVTPHVHYRRGQVGKDVIEQKLEQLKEVVKEVLPELSLYAGNELYYSSQVMELLRKGEVCTMADSKYVLVEFSPEVEYLVLRNAVLELQSMGLWPIIAHVERYFCCLKHPKQAIELAQMGAYLQVNVGSLLGRHGFRMKQFVKKLCAMGYVSFVATDAHDTVHRTLELSKGAAYIKKKFGEAKMEQYFIEHPQAILEKKRI